MVEAEYSPANDFARHARFRGIDERIPSQRIHFHAQLVLHELASLPTCQPITSNDRRWVDFLLHQLVRAPQKLRCDEDDRGCAIADLLVLLLGQINKYASSWVLNCKESEDCRAVI